MNATAILPVKRFARAKTRLLGDLIGPQERAALLRAMLTDVMAAIERSAAIERVVVVTAEGQAEKLAMESAKRMGTPVEVLQARKFEKLMALARRNCGFVSRA